MYGKPLLTLIAALTATNVFLVLLLCFINFNDTDLKACLRVAKTDNAIKLCYEYFAESEDRE